MSLTSANLNPLQPEPAGRARRVDEKALKKACQEFESLFIHQLLQGLRRTVPETGLMHGGFGERIFRDLHDQALSQELAKAGGLGLGEMLYRQLLGQPLNQKAAAGQAARHYLPPVKPQAQSALTEAGLETAAETEPQISWPIDGRLSSRFGLRFHPIHGREAMHKGIDIAAAEGTPVKAFQGGRVVFSGWKEGYGNLVEIDHGQGLTTRYGHNQENLVQVGQEVEAGEAIALVGATGLATGPHLHFEIRRQGEPLDPVGLLQAQAAGLRKDP